MAQKIIGTSLEAGTEGVAIIIVDLGWYAQRRRTFTLERNPDSSRCEVLLNA